MTLSVTRPGADGWRHIADVAGALVVAVYLAIICTIGALQPDLGWDALAYSAAVFEWNGMTPEAAHAAAYAAVEKATSPAQYQMLVAGDAYRLAQAQSWQAFHSVQPLYTAKAAYIAVLSTLDPLVGGPIKAMWVVNWVSVAAFAALLCVWLQRAGLWMAAPLVVATLLTLDFASAVAGPMPDLAASALILAGSLAVLSKPNVLTLVLFAAAFALRPDTLVLMIALTITTVGARLEWRGVATLLVAALLASILTKSAVGHPGWWPHFYFSTVTIQPTMDGFDPAFSLAALAKGYARGIITTLTTFDWVAPLAVAVFTSCAAFANGLKLNRRATALVVAMVLTIIGKFVLFPLPDARVYLPCVLVIVLLTLQQLRPTFVRA